MAEDPASKKTNLLIPPGLLFFSWILGNVLFVIPHKFFPGLAALVVMAAVGIVTRI